MIRKRITKRALRNAKETTGPLTPDVQARLEPTEPRVCSSRTRRVAVGTVHEGAGGSGRGPGLVARTST